jgi:hypothetical protein
MTRASFSSQFQFAWLLLRRQQTMNWVEHKFSCSSGVRLSLLEVWPQMGLFYKPRWEMSMEHWWNDNWQGKTDFSREKPATLCIRNPTWTVLGLNPGFPIKRPATKCLSTSCKDMTTTVSTSCTVQMLCCAIASSWVIWFGNCMAKLLKYCDRQ